MAAWMIGFSIPSMSVIRVFTGAAGMRGLLWLF